jgi:hypothetical protein
MRQLAGARTPAEFRRHWNKPAQQFFQEYAFRRFAAGGHPARGILATFVLSGLIHEYVLGVAAGRIQGWQLLFFSSHGVASFATIRLRPSGCLSISSIVATLAFNLLMATVFFYSPRHTG